MATYTYISRMATIDERFERFLRLHPEVYAEFKRIAGELLAGGKQRYGAKAIMEKIRFGDARDAVLLNCNNTYVSRMARRLMAEDTRFQNFFEVRTTRNV